MNFTEHHQRQQEIIARESERRLQPPDGPPTDYSDALDEAQRINRSWKIVEDIEEWSASVEWDQIQERYVVLVNGEDLDDWRAELVKHAAVLSEFAASL